MIYPYETATDEQKRIGSLWWCVHHEVHVEPLTEPPEARVKYILTWKPSRGRHVRLLNFAPVLHPERIPGAVTKRCAAYNKAAAAYNKAPAGVASRSAYNKAWAKYVKAGTALQATLTAHEPELAALHREEYPNTTWNGTSIFGEESHQ